MAEAAAERSAPLFFPLMNRSEWFARGATLVGLDRQSAAFLQDAVRLGAVERRYHVLCRVPACVSSRLAVEEAAQAASLRSNIANRSIRDRITSSQVVAAREAGVPGCIFRDGSIAGSLFDGTLLRPRGIIASCFTAATEDSEKVTVHRQLSQLFAGASQAGRAVGPGAGCGSHCPCFEQASVMHPARVAVVAGPSTPVPVHRSAVRAPVRSLGFELLGFNDERRLALYAVDTVDASEAQVRAAFAFSGLPVVNDPYFDVSLGDTLDAWAKQDKLAPAFSLTRGATATDRDRALLALLKRHAEEADGADPQLGMVCTEISFPNPDSHANRGRLLHLAAAQSARDGSTRSRHAVRLFGSANAGEATSSGRLNTTKAFDNVRVSATDAAASLLREALAGCVDVAVPEAPAERPQAISWDGEAVDDSIGAKDDVPAVEAQQGLTAASATALAALANAPVPRALIATRDLLATVSSGEPPIVAYSSRELGASHADDGPKPRRAARCSYCSGEHLLTSCPHLSGGRSLAMQNGSGQPQRHFCVRCGEEGHLVDRCRLSLYARVVGGRCIICDAQGPPHEARACPDRVEPPQPFDAHGIADERLTRREPRRSTSQRERRVPVVTRDDSSGGSHGRPRGGAPQRRPTGLEGARKGGLHATDRGRGGGHRGRGGGGRGNRDEAEPPVRRDSGPLFRSLDDGDDGQGWG
jgi:hypothetical protein